MHLIRMKKLQEVHNSNILLDTNILIHYADDEFKERSGNILSVLYKNKNLLSISEITGFELLNCHPTDKRREKYFKFISRVSNHPVTRDILSNAAILSNECKRLTGQQNRIFPIPDLILGGTVMYYTTDLVFVLTADQHDFFEPLWETVAYTQVLKNDKENVDVHIYLLSLNRMVLQSQYKVFNTTSL